MTLIPFCSATGGFFPCGGEPGARPGDLEFFDLPEESLLGYRRSYEGEILLVFHNFSRGAELPWTWYRRRRRSCSPAMTVKAGMEAAAAAP